MNVLSTRVMFSGRFDPIKSRQIAYKNVFSATKYILAQEGILGFYRGLIPSLFLHASIYAKLLATWDETEEQ